jgi:general secretion pathway protein H
MRFPARSSRGFTLIELLVVLGIISLVLSYAISSRPNAATARVTVAARSVALTLQLARARAMAGNIETVVRIDAEKGEFGMPGAVHALPNGTTVALTIAENERFGNGGGLRFYPDGQSSGGEIVLGLDGRSSRIEVNWLTGEPRLSQ